MLLDIKRCGSGWGGAHGHWIVDVENSIAYDIYDNRQPNVMILPDISLLKLLDGCYVYAHPECVCMDCQLDYVHVLNHGTQRCVLNTDCGVYPENEALHGKLLKLIEYLPWK